MELRERVTEIIEAALVRHGVALSQHEGTLDDADAAIAAVLDAMGEPTHGMVEIGTKSTFTPVDEQDAELVWSNMLAAFRTEALGEE